MSTAAVVHIEEQATDLSARAAAVVIADQASYAAAGEMLTGIKTLRREAEAHHRPIIESAHRTHTLACAALNKIDRPLLAAEQFIKQRIAGYTMKQERLKREADRLGREAAERKREQDALAVAIQVEEEGASVEEVAAVLEEAVTAPLVQPMQPPAPPPVAVKGISSRVTYKVRVDSPKALLLAVLADGSPYSGLLVAGDSFIGVSVSALNTMAKAQGGKLGIPGTTVIEDRGISVRG